MKNQNKKENGKHKNIKGKNGKSKDMLIPTDADDILLGGNKSEVIKGGLGNDKISGRNGKDTLYGEAGNDELTGGNGNDILVGMNAIPAAPSPAGTTPTAPTPAPEVDILIGGNGKDTFVLGQAGMAFYTSAADADYAVIKDFKQADRIQLSGLPTSYTVGATATGAGIYMSKVDPTTGAQSSELIAVLEGVNATSVNLSARNFVFV